MESNTIVEIIDNKYKFLIGILGSHTVQLTSEIVHRTPRGAMYNIDTNKFTVQQLEQFCDVLAAFNNITREDIKKDLIANGFSIPVESCLMHNISIELIEIMRNNFKRQIKFANNDDFPGTPEAELFWIAMMVIIFMLGEKWHNDNIKKAKQKNETRMKYLITPQSNKKELLAHQFRTILLADCLFVLQFVKGFKYKLSEMRNLSPEKPQVMIEDYITELLIGKMLVEDGHQIFFRKPIQKKGEDYDIDIILKNDINLCAEIKCKRQDSAVNINNLRTKLIKASDQLPKDKKGIILIKVSEKLIRKKEFKSEAEGFLQAFYKNHPHVIAVVIIWEGSLSLVGGGGMNYIKHHISINRKQLFIEVYLKHLFKSNLSFDAIHNDFIEVSFGKF